MNISELSRLAFFKAEKYEFSNKNVCDFRNIPRPHFCMGLIIKGEASFHEEDEEEIYVKPGDIIFVPITSRYISKWRGQPDILYISMHFAFDAGCGISEKNIKVQKVTLPDFEGLKGIFRFIYENSGAKESEQFASLGAFFKILADVLPLLEQKTVQYYDKRIEKAIEHINMHSEESMSVSELAKMSNMSVPNFHLCFKKYSGMTPIEYKNQVCIARAMRLLKTGNRFSIEEISSMVGFESSTYFRRIFKRVTGKTPLEYRKSQIGI